MNQSCNPLARSRRPRRVIGRVLASISLAVALLAAPTSALAADEDTGIDGRLEGYGSKANADGTTTGGGVSTVVMQKSGVGGTWIIFMILSVLGCSVLFKNSKRNVSAK